MDSEEKFTEADLWAEIDQYVEKREVKQPGDITIDEFWQKYYRNQKKETARKKMAALAERSNGKLQYVKDVYDSVKKRNISVLRKTKQDE